MFEGIMFTQTNQTVKKKRMPDYAYIQKELLRNRVSGTDSPLADAILDRIVHDAYIINIQPVDPSKDLSMREVYGLAKTLSE